MISHDFKNVEFYYTAILHAWRGKWFSDSGPEGNDFSWYFQVGCGMVKYLYWFFSGRYLKTIRVVFGRVGIWKRSACSPLALYCAYVIFNIIILSPLIMHIIYSFPFNSAKYQINGILSIAELSVLSFLKYSMKYR